MTRAEFLQLAALRLQKAGVPESGAEAVFLLQTALDLTAAALMLHRAQPLSSKDEEKAMEWLARREKHEPLWRIKGARGFWKADFAMNEATLEPRPDSETLIEAALEHTHPQRILDIGTGTGCLLLSLLQEYDMAQGVGTDKSARALEAAKQNAQSLNVQNRVQFMETDWATGVEGEFDLVISNPPYIPAADVPQLDKAVRDYDPALALNGGADGLDAYRALSLQIPKLLNENGVAIVEIGQGQEGAVDDLFTGGGLKLIEARRDLGGVIRALSFIKKVEIKVEAEAANALASEIIEP